MDLELLGSIFFEVEQGWSLGGQKGSDFGFIEAKLPGYGLVSR